MCTAFSCGGLFGRTLDFERSFGEKLLFVPRNHSLDFRYAKRRESHFAFLGVGVACGNFPLMFDGVSELGVFAAALNFPRSAVYSPHRCGAYNLASFEVLPWVLSGCESAREGAELLRRSCILGEGFSEEMPSSPLHWFLADEENCFTVEAVAGGTRVYENPVGVLTNEPPFPYQLEHLSGFSGLSASAHIGGFTEEIGLTPHSRGVGSFGLPGDFSSPSRFVRAAFTLHSFKGFAEQLVAERSAEEKGGVKKQSDTEWMLSALLGATGTFSVPPGSVVTEGGEYSYTRYTSVASREGYRVKTCYSPLPTVKCFSDFDLDGFEITVSTAIC